MRLPRDPRPLADSRCTFITSPTQDKLNVYHRWDAGGPRDDVVVIANFAPSRPFLLEGRPVGRRCLGHSLQQRLKQLQSGLHELRQLRPFREAGELQRNAVQRGIGPYTALVLSQD
jgi:hypothetical protein